NSYLALRVLHSFPTRRSSDLSFIIEGQDPKATGAFPDEEIRVITPDFFRVLQTPLLKGRFFHEADTADSTPVVIVNQAFAKKYRSEEHTSELQSQSNLVCRLL